MRWVDYLGKGEVLTKALYTRPSFSAKTSKKLGRYFFAEETGRVYIFVEETVEKLDEPKREQVLYFLDGSLIWLVEILDGLVFNEKLGRLYAKKLALAQIKVGDGSKSSICNGDNTFLKL